MFFLPQIQPRDYPAMQGFCPDLPDSFDDWADQQLKEQQRCESQEKQYLNVPITSADFKNYCKATRLLPNLVTFRAFVAANSAKVRK